MIIFLKENIFFVKIKQMIQKNQQQKNLKQKNQQQKNQQQKKYIVFLMNVNYKMLLLAKYFDDCFNPIIKRMKRLIYKQTFVSEIQIKMKHLSNYFKSLENVVVVNEFDDMKKDFFLKYNELLTLIIEKCDKKIYHHEDLDKIYSIRSIDQKTSNGRKHKKKYNCKTF